MPVQAHDLRETEALIHDLTAGHLLADRAFDADWLRTDLTDRGITPIIPPKSNRKFPAEFDKETYKWRHLIENYFGKLQENNRSELHGFYFHRGKNHSNKVNLNSP